MTTTLDDTMATTDEAAVRALYQQLMQAWNAGDGFAFAAPFTDEASFIAFDGTKFNGRAEIGPFHDRLFKTHLAGTRLVGQVTSVRFLADDIAVVTAFGGTIARGKTAPSPERDSLQTLVAVKRDGTWTLEAFQNTRLRPMGRNFTGTIHWLIGDLLWRVLRPGR
jgi:uncharacterized protein (TIGR02246 family)